MKIRMTMNDYNKNELNKLCDEEAQQVKETVNKPKRQKIIRSVEFKPIFCTKKN